MLAPLCQPDTGQHGGRGLERPGTGLATDQQRHGHVLEGRKLAQQVMELVNEAQLAVAQRSAGLFREGIEPLAIDRHPAPRGLVQPAQQVQQRALAGAGGADDGHHFTRRHAEIDVLQDGKLAPALVVVLLQALAVQDGMPAVRRRRWMRGGGVVVRGCGHGGMNLQGKIDDGRKCLNA